MSEVIEAKSHGLWYIFPPWQQPYCEYTPCPWGEKKNVMMVLFRLVAIPYWLPVIYAYNRDEIWLSWTA